MTAEILLSPVDVMVSTGERDYQLRIWQAVFIGEKAKYLARGFGGDQDSAVASLYEKYRDIRDGEDL